MSLDLRKKSAAREASWRQNTLYAAYTASTAKRATNAMAGAAVDEIVRQIKHFSSPGNFDAINEAVRGIVKKAAETWRYARLEREMIVATMPTEDKQETSDSTDQDRSFRGEGDAQQTSPSSRKVLLCLFPVVTREPLQESSPSDVTRGGIGCILSPGKTMYSDSPFVLERVHELQTSRQDRPIGQNSSFAERAGRSGTFSSSLPPDSRNHATE
ncbi:MAG: hypothetical protein M4579_000711 [Chaenotheca gracillima]|nr:MAG: hypothetical protein M4579_000711 [Chaenotheca gracillima]